LGLDSLIVVFRRLKQMCTRGHWRPAEDEKLKELVEKYGPHNWNAIAEKLHGRSGENLNLKRN
jgi:myb proto-oncogene protein